jgi:hypothetical protein
MENGYAWLGVVGLYHNRRPCPDFISLSSEAGIALPPILKYFLLKVVLTRRFIGVRPPVQI